MISRCKKSKRKNKISEEVLQQSAAALRVLAHPDRLRIVELLIEKELSVGQLAEEANLAQNTCSQHLNQMRAHGLLASERKGKEVFYRVTHPSAFKVIECILDNAD